MKKITIKVNLNNNSYPVIISKNLLNNAGAEIKKAIPKAKRFLLITDKIFQRLIFVQYYLL